MQFRPEAVGQRSLGDVRVRRAVVSALDRQALNEGMFEGELQMSDTFYTRYSRYERVQDVDRALADADRAVTHYPYDVRRAEQLMGEAGFAKDRDGQFTSATGERPTLEIRWI